MATQVIQPFRVAGPYTLSIPVRGGTAPVSETWKRGALLARSSGRLIEAGADPTLIVGVAIHDVTVTVAGDEVKYVPAHLGVEFEGSLMGAAAANYTLVQTDMYLTYGVAADATTGYLSIDQCDTSANLVVITGFVDPVGDINARVRFIFLQAGTLAGIAL